MAWKEVSNNAIDIKTQVGNEVTGKYLGSRTFDSQYGEQHIYNFEGKPGVYGFTSLNRAMESVPVGATVKIVYKGKEIIETKRGKVPMHQCQVFVDDTTLPKGAEPEFPAFDPDEIPA